MGEISFTATLQKRGPAAAVVLDDEQVAAVGEGARRFPVRATVAGYSWRGSVARMRGEFLLGMSCEIREATRSRSSSPSTPRSARSRCRRR